MANNNDVEINESNEKNIKLPPVLFTETQSLINRIESTINKKLIVYWTSNKGAVCQNDVQVLYEIFTKIGKNEKLALFIKSNGGDVEAALRIVNLIRDYCDHLETLIPLQCASSATMIALGSNEISMGPLSYLTAIDSAIRHDMSPIDTLENRKIRVSQDELSRIVKLWQDASKDHHGNPYSDVFQYIHPLVIGALNRSNSLSIKICQEILSYHMMDKDKCMQISNYLNSGYPSHSYPITSKEAKNIGLNVTSISEDLNKQLLQLNKLYSEMAQIAITDYDEYSYHDNEILNIIEANGAQIYYQNDNDWKYFKEERRWQILNNESSWRIVEKIDNETINKKFYIG